MIKNFDTYVDGENLALPVGKARFLIRYCFKKYDFKMENVCSTSWWNNYRFPNWESKHNFVF